MRESRRKAAPDKRGSAESRRRRRQYLLNRYGNGKWCLCFHCRKVLTSRTLQIDRIVPGGSYARYNTVPACWPCNRAKSNDPDWVGPNPISSQELAAIDGL